MVTFDLDEIGAWSELKIEIVRQYSTAYSTILAGNKAGVDFKYVYVDAFAGAGLHYSKESGTVVKGSPLTVLDVHPPFHEYHFVDADQDKVAYLKMLVGKRPDVRFYTGDCNQVLVRDIYPTIKYAEFKRALCFIDPYGMHLDWDIIEKAGKQRTIDVILHFPIMDMNRNVLLHDRSKVPPDQSARMDAFWGDQSWRDAAYKTTENLFGIEEKTCNADLVAAFQDRMRHIGGFRYVSTPIAMRNSNNAVVYYLLIGSQSRAAMSIAQYLKKKYDQRC